MIRLGAYLKRGPNYLRVYAVTDPDCNARQGRTMLEAVRQAIEGGATIVQLREKETDAGAFVATAREALALCRQYGVPLVINDRVDVCLAVGADGVHVGQSDIPRRGRPAHHRTRPHPRRVHEDSRPGAGGVRRGRGLRRGRGGVPDDHQEGLRRPGARPAREDLRDVAAAGRGHRRHQAGEHRAVHEGGGGRRGGRQRHLRHAQPRRGVPADHAGGGCGTGHRIVA